MDDILPLLNINMSYNERVALINNIVNQGNSNYFELNLNVVSTSLNYDKDNYIITPKGLKNSKRKAQDGIVLFGYERKNNRKSNDDNINSDNNNIVFSRNNKHSETYNDDYGKDFLLNDFIFPIEEKEDNCSLYEFPNFAIYYNTSDGNYYIKDFNTGVGALMKIKRYIMEGNILINIGGNYLVIYIEKNKIIIKIFNNSILEGTTNTNDKNNVNCDLKEFDIDENQNYLINIGRNQNCDIIIEDMMLSKIQCCIEYNANDKCFYLNDGDGKKESTNGTWVFILNPTKITNNFMFKAEHTLFVANLINK